MKINLIIQTGSGIYEPVTEESVTLDLERQGQPGKLSFIVIKDENIAFTEGNAVALKVDGANMFYGFVFKKQRNRDGTIQVTCYDQLRYLKNKDTYVYTNKTAGELLRMIAADFRLNIGTIENTGYSIPSKIEDNQTLFDMIQNALYDTLVANNKLYILYDDYGKLTLREVGSLKSDLIIDAESGENFNYTSSIDDQTYNKIKLSYENEDAGTRDIYIAQDSENINNWGVLQYFETLKNPEYGTSKADALLTLYNQKTRTLTLENVFGDTRIRAGSLLPVKLPLGDINVSNYMMVEKVQHKFNCGEHTMNLTLVGGEFIA